MYLTVQNQIFQQNKKFKFKTLVVWNNFWLIILQYLKLLIIRFFYFKTAINVITKNIKIENLVIKFKNHFASP